MTLQIKRTCSVSRKFDAERLSTKSVQLQRHILIQLLKFKDKKLGFWAPRKEKEVPEEGDRG